MNGEVASTATAHGRGRVRPARNGAARPRFGVDCRNPIGQSTPLKPFVKTPRTMRRGSSCPPHGSPSASTQPPRREPPGCRSVLGARDTGHSSAQESPERRSRKRCSLPPVRPAASPTRSRIVEQDLVSPYRTGGPRVSPGPGRLRVRLLSRLPAAPDTSLPDGLPEAGRWSPPRQPQPFRRGGRTSRLLGRRSRTGVQRQVSLSWGVLYVSDASQRDP